LFDEYAVRLFQFRNYELRTQRVVAFYEKSESIQRTYSVSYISIVYDAVYLYTSSTYGIFDEIIYVSVDLFVCSNAVRF